MSIWKPVEGVSIPLCKLEPHAMFLTQSGATLNFKEGSKIELVTVVGAPHVVAWVTKADGTRLNYIVDIRDIAAAIVKATGINPEQ